MLLNILSNIWFYPITVLFNKSREDQLIDIKKLQLEYGFTKIINLDDELKFWWMKNNEEYINEIQQQLDKKNITRLQKKFKSYINLILKNNLDTPENSILFVSINSIECMYAFHIYIYLNYCGISKDNRNLALNVINIIKNKYPFKINIDEKLKSILF